MSVTSSCVEILFQPGPLRGKNLDLSELVPLKPVILEDTIGITSTEDALIESSPNPRDNEQAFCKKKQFYNIKIRRT